MTGYGSSLYGSDWYVSSPYRANTVLYYSIKARIVKPAVASPPVMDTISVGLAQRFDWLQMGIQAFSLFNKIDYATDESDGIRLSLDDVWGQIYKLPRLTGESNDDYRKRLKTYAKVLIGSGTIPACQEVLDVLIEIPGGSRVSSYWPARALIDFPTVEAMRAARSHLTLINSVLPGMFAAGVDYELLIPYMDVGIIAAIKGDATREYNIRAAVAADQEISYGIDALVAYGRVEYCSILAAVAKTWTRYIRTRAAIRGDRLIEPTIIAAIQGDAELPLAIRAAVATEQDRTISYYAAIQAEPELSYGCLAAVARTFEMQCGILARIVYMFELSYNIKAAVRGQREQSVGIRARIARRIE